MKMKNLIARIF